MLTQSSGWMDTKMSSQKSKVDLKELHAMNEEALCEIIYDMAKIIKDQQQIIGMLGGDSPYEVVN